jgi:hypothetical protein
MAKPGAWLTFNCRPSRLLCHESQFGEDGQGVSVEPVKQDRAGARVRGVGKRFIDIVGQGFPFGAKPGVASDCSDGSL